MITRLITQYRARIEWLRAVNEAHQAINGRLRVENNALKAVNEAHRAINGRLREENKALREQLKHGYWKGNNNGTFTCSVCGGTASKMAWCGHCGAKMDSEVTEK